MFLRHAWPFASLPRCFRLIKGEGRKIRKKPPTTLHGSTEKSRSWRGVNQGARPNFKSDATPHVKKWWQRSATNPPFEAASHENDGKYEKVRSSISHAPINTVSHIHTALRLDFFSCRSCIRVFHSISQLHSLFSHAPSNTVSHIHTSLCLYFFSHCSCIRVFHSSPIPTACPFFGYFS